MKILPGTNITLNEYNIIGVPVPETYEEYNKNVNYWYSVLDQLAKSSVGHMIQRVGIIPYHYKLSPPADDEEVRKYFDHNNMQILDFVYVSHSKGYKNVDDGSMVYTMFKFGIFKSAVNDEFWSLVEAYEYEVEETDIYYNIFIDPISMIFIEFKY